MVDLVIEQCVVLNLVRVVLDDVFEVLCILVVEFLCGVCDQVDVIFVLYIVCNVMCSMEVYCFYQQVSSWIYSGVIGWECFDYLEVVFDFYCCVQIFDLLFIDVYVQVVLVFFDIFWFGGGKIGFEEVVWQLFCVFDFDFDLFLVNLLCGIILCVQGELIEVLLFFDWYIDLVLIYVGVYVVCVVCCWQLVQWQGIVDDICEVVCFVLYVYDELVVCYFFYLCEYDEVELLLEQVLCDSLNDVVFVVLFVEIVLYNIGMLW